MSIIWDNDWVVGLTSKEKDNNNQDQIYGENNENEEHNQNNNDYENRLERKTQNI